MCKVCIQHGDGKKWYLESKFYSEELEKQGKRDYLSRLVYERFEIWYARLMRYTGFFDAIPILGRMVKGVSEPVVHREHFGQIIPSDDIPAVLSLATSIYRTPCVCKMVMRGILDHNYCLGFGMFPKGYFKAYADYSEHTKEIDRDEALGLIQDCEKRGAYHSIWTYRTPFIGKLCNCDQSDCAAFTAQARFGIKIVHKSEYIFSIDSEKCNGCRSCKEMCQFGAIEYKVEEKLCAINPALCYGCGICRVRCKQEAITIQDRNPVLGW